MSNWTVEYDNDVGRSDDYLVEFWNVLDEAGNKVAQCDSEEMAQKLADYPALLEALESLFKVCESEGFENSVTGRQLIMKQARALIAKHRGGA